MFFHFGKVRHFWTFCRKSNRHPEKCHLILHKKAKKSRLSPAQQHVDTEAPAPQSTTSSLDGRQHKHQSQHQLCRHIDNVISACYGPWDLSITHRCIDGKKNEQPKVDIPCNQFREVNLTVFCCARKCRTIPIWNSTIYRSGWDPISTTISNVKPNDTNGTQAKSIT